MNNVKLKWLDLNRTGQGYKVYGSDSSFDETTLPTALATLPTGTSEYTDENVPYGTTRHYIISAIDSDGNEEYSEPFSVLVQENIYGLTNENTLKKFSYDMEMMWSNNVIGSGSYPSLDTDIDGNVSVAVQGTHKFFLFDSNGITKYSGSFNEDNSNTSLRSFSSITLNDKVIYIRPNTSGTETTVSKQTRNISIVNITDVNNIIVDDNIDTTFVSFLIGLSLYSDTRFVAYKQNELLIVDFPNTILWKTTLLSDQPTSASVDSLGFIYLGYSDGTIAKVFPDFDAYDVDPDSEEINSNRIIWEDATTFSGLEIVSVKNTRDGNLLVCSTDGYLVKFNTNEEQVWDINLAHPINDMRVDYNDNVILATDDSMVIRVDVNGNISDEYTIDESLSRISIDPGLSHIRNGSIIEFSSN